MEHIAMADRPVEISLRYGVVRGKIDNCYRVVSEAGVVRAERADGCLMVPDAGDLVLIDSGAGKSFDKLVSNIEWLGLDPKRLKTVLVTHAHIDHIGALHRFQQEYGVQIIAHELDAAAIEEGRGTAAEAYDVRYTPCHVDMRLQSAEEILRFGVHELKVIHIPGHTPGSVAAYLDTDNKRVLFGQDIHGPYYPEWGADPAHARLSLRKLLELKADILCVERQR